MKVKNLSAEQIEVIGAVLHTHMQFYSATGIPANNSVIDEIEEVLASHPLAE